jgi:hypothetical protein
MDSISKIIDANNRFINFTQSKEIELARLKVATDEGSKEMVASKAMVI